MARLLLVLVLVGLFVGDAVSVGEPVAETEPVRWLRAAGIEHAEGYELDVYAPPQRGDERLAVSVLLHGCCGERSDLVKLAEATAAAGMVVFNADWPGLRGAARYPDTYAVAACAVRFARDSAGAYGGDAERLALTGWSDGALVAAVLALAPDLWSTRDCRSAAPLGSLTLIGVAGFYGWDTPVPDAYVTQGAVRLFGGTPATAAGRWAHATPYAWIDRRPAIAATLVTGSDELRADAERFTCALRRGGHDPLLVVVPASGDQTMLSPRTLEGRTAARAIATAVRFPAASGASSRTTDSGNPCAQVGMSRLRRGGGPVPAVGNTERR